MYIEHPLLGSRSIDEFIYYGDASLLKRPFFNHNKILEKFHKYLYLRKNPNGIHSELWFHLYGDRSWLIVERDTKTHEIRNVILANKELGLNDEKKI